jgi:phosphoglycolate phosphatase-like HAD superfamily hydrolase
MEPSDCPELNRPVLFIDNDGTLTDAREHGRHYRRRLGELMAPTHGGTVEKWAKANEVCFNASMDWYHDHIAEYQDASFWDDWDRVWVVELFKYMGLEPPSWDDGIRLTRRLAFECPAGVNTLFPRAGHAVWELSEAGFRLNLASNAHSLHCRGVLVGAGLTPYFVCAFGPDLVNLPDKSVEFYRRIFAYVGTTADQAIVIDDNGPPLDMAREAGARTVLVDQGHGRETPRVEPDSAVGSISELPAAIFALAQGSP